MNRFLSKSLLAVVLTVGTAALGHAAARLENISLAASGGTSHLLLSANGPVQFKDFTLQSPDRIVVDCWGAEGSPVVPILDDVNVKSVSFTPIEGSAGAGTRMIVTLNRPAEYSVLRRTTALEVMVQAGGAHSVAAMAEAAPARTGRVSLDIQGADVKTVLRTLAEASGRNIVPNKDVKGQVSISIRNVPWRDALNALCKAHDLGYKEEGGIIRVAAIDVIQNEDINRATVERKQEDLLPLETRVVHVSFANVDELRSPVGNTLTKRGRVDADPRTSSLLITDIAERAEAAEKLAKQLDRRTPQITINAKLVDVDEASARDLGIRWNTARTTGTTTFIPNVNAGIGDPAGALRLGVGSVDPLSGMYSDLDLKLQALERDRKANVLSNPTITTVDNREAKILVGQKIPLIVADAAGNAITQLTTIGVMLRVTPHLNEDNKITMDIHPEVSDLSAQATVQGGVIINTAEADARVCVEDGQTAVIGGLIRRNESSLETGVPFLKDIPVLGMLFKSRSKVIQKRELMIMVTPHLVTGNPGR